MNCTFIIFGITGDLSKRKLLPGLFKLIQDKKIQDYAIVGFGLEDTAIENIFDLSKPFVNENDHQSFLNLVSRSTYVKGNATSLDDFHNLKNVIARVEKQFNLSGNRLAYCATPTFVFADITENLVAADILKRTDSSMSWNRIAYEKPFGLDFENSHNLNKRILSLLDESQVYRIDHYLAKAIIDNILYMRFTNRVFEALWNNQNIESVQIILSERIGLDGRGSYFDKFGVLKDIVQNHMLQLLALVAMDDPKTLDIENIREKKSNILNRVRVVDGFFGQYEDYLNEKGVSKDSKTESFAVLKIEIDDPLWKGVPFYFKTGKCLKEKETKIHIQFKKTDCRLLKSNCPIEGNYLTLDLYPQGGFSFEINAKKPDSKNELIPVVMDFCYDCLFKPISPEAYENILMCILKGDRSISVGLDEIQSSWRIIDSIYKMNFPLYQYQKQTTGPENELKEFANRNHFTWKG
jgi:glucose-6-phosphate 1-dehydrogenase